jgi:glycine cleavage system transcriptional repressor
MRKHLVLTASGKDRPGIIEQFTRTLVHFSGNVEASRMARLGGEFAMLMLVSAPAEQIGHLRAAVVDLGDADFEVQTRLTDIDTEGSPGSTPCGISVMGTDHVGIIHEVSQYLTSQGISVETLDTDVVTAPTSGSPLFTMFAVVRLPQGMSVDALRDALEDLEDDIGVSTAVQPHATSVDIG